VTRDATPLSGSLTFAERELLLAADVSSAIDSEDNEAYWYFASSRGAREKTHRDIARLLGARGMACVANVTGLEPHAVEATARERLRFLFNGPGDPSAQDDLDALTRAFVARAQRLLDMMRSPV